MPEEGIKYVPRKELLSYEEMHRIVSMMASLGINKVRITGGEPFLRKGMMEFMESIFKIDGIEKLNLTTNGTLTKGLVKDFKKVGIDSVNLSLDSLDQERFYKITRRDDLPKVLETLNELLKEEITVKINAVLMAGKNTQDILPMIELAKKDNISVRFIEEMPFNGEGARPETEFWNYKMILDHIKQAHPSLTKVADEANSTSLNYKINGYKGSVGVIPAFSRTFCGTCNRIRLTPQGQLKTCLYDEGVFNIKNLIRSGATDEQLKTTFLDALNNRAKDGFEAEKRRGINKISESMSTIGG
jgi:cyclic pyranopterin phosphate synthase